MLGGPEGASRPQQGSGRFPPQTEAQDSASFLLEGRSGGRFRKSRAEVAAQEAPMMAELRALRGRPPRRQTCALSPGGDSGPPKSPGGFRANLWGHPRGSMLAERREAYANSDRVAVPRHSRTDS